MKLLIQDHYFATLPILKVSFLCVFLTGCASYKVPTQSIAKDPHWLYSFVPRHQSQIEWYDVGHWTTWALFGNDDDGLFGEEPTAHFHPDEQPNIIKAAKWFARNPCHNLCFYVLGSADRDNSAFTLLSVDAHHFEAFCYHRLAKKNFGGEGTSFLAAFHGGKPYVSLRIIWPKNKRTDLYLGWRNRGNLGAKCVLLGNQKKCYPEESTIKETNDDQPAKI